MDLIPYALISQNRTSYLIEFLNISRCANSDGFELDFVKSFLIIFPSIYDEKIQWSTSGIENVTDFCHFVT